MIFEKYFMTATHNPKTEKTGRWPLPEGEVSG